MPSKSSDRSKILNLGVFWGEDVPFATFVMIRPPDSVESAVGYPENPDRHRFFKIFYGFNRFYIIDLLYSPILVQIRLVFGSGRSISEFKLVQSVIFFCHQVFMSSKLSDRFEILYLEVFGVRMFLLLYFRHYPTPGFGRIGGGIP